MITNTTPDEVERMKAIAKAVEGKRVDDTLVAYIAQISPDTSIEIRTERGRFMVPASDAAHFLRILRASKEDTVRRLIINCRSVTLSYAFDTVAPQSSFTHGEN
jgi:hypothetical protein